MSGRTQTDLVLGTAGHIDHGKSSLVLALTGTDPDRLAEEKQRGITIELGFARLALPDGTVLGVVVRRGRARSTSPPPTTCTGEYERTTKRSRHATGSGSSRRICA